MSHETTVGVTSGYSCVQHMLAPPPPPPFFYCRLSLLGIATLAPNDAAKPHEPSDDYSGETKTSGRRKREGRKASSLRRVNEEKATAAKMGRGWNNVRVKQVGIEFFAQMRRVQLRRLAQPPRYFLVVYHDVQGLKNICIPRDANL